MFDTNGAVSQRKLRDSPFSFKMKIQKSRIFLASVDVESSILCRYLWEAHLILEFKVLVPDIICFEERRKYANGLEPLENDKDFWNHLNEMCYRVLSGDLLMRKILEDTMNAITLLSEIPGVDKNRIGTLGHSMGGNTVQFLAAMDKRISFACASGSACSYKNKMEHNVGMELSIVVPNLYRKYDIQDLLACIAPRRLLIVSADDDKYSRDASDVVDEARKTYSQMNAEGNITHVRYQGGHALTQERFDYIVNWMITNT